ncbi:hypothetical protein BDV95DRAFT_43177 [Massariosphaeria phaeospora]|uniref:Uncharacterized protein n=1 Tax=Massariosphaeria phaeospora TaxID=100035 RepID=A0A7C8I5U0_9PLEO|nr:hypothetical protein BDV95DRAFT_43177 [Massariosphaeria phaeospora]
MLPTPPLTNSPRFWLPYRRYEAYLHTEFAVYPVSVSVSRMLIASAPASGYNLIIAQPWHVHPRTTTQRSEHRAHTQLPGRTRTTPYTTLCTRFHRVLC